MTVPTEAEEGRALVAYLRLNGYRFHHSANETGSGRGARFQGIRNKQQGVSKGFPDYLIWLKSGRMIAIELKRLRGSSTSREQKEWIEFLNNTGTPAQISKGWVAAKEFIERQETKGEHEQRRSY